MPLPDTPDYVGIILRGLANPAARKQAERHLAIVLANESPLSGDHGKHHPRASDVGRCSLEYAADNLGLLDLSRAVDSQLIVDTGTLMGAWLACVLKDQASSEGQPFVVHPEITVTRDGVSGHVDGFIEWLIDGARLVEPLEFKSTSSSAQLKPPDVRKLAQCLQAAFYGDADEVKSERFTLISYGYNVGDDREGNPHPKMRQDSYLTKDYVPLVDEEVRRLRVLASMTQAEMESRMEELADAEYCKTCRFSRCAKNRNPSRYALV